MECSNCDTIFRISSRAGRTLGSFQVGPNLLYAFLLSHQPELPTPSHDEHLEQFKMLVREFHGITSSLIQQQSDSTRVVFVPVYEVETPSYHQGRILLIGDAAHAFPPNLAQGAAMAIEDAVNLCELLSESSDLGWVLESYESKRRPRLKKIRAAVRRRGIISGLEGAVTPELLREHPAIFSESLSVYDELIEEPFVRS